MPQLTPFYFTNQVVVTFLVISIIITYLSLFKLPNLIRLFICRLYPGKIV